MSEIARLLEETADRILADHLAERPDTDAAGHDALWQALEAAGLALLFVPEDRGGADLAPADGEQLTGRERQAQAEAVVAKNAALQEKLAGG